MNYTVHGILQARILEWIAFPFSGDLPNPGIKPRSPTLQADSFLAELQGKPKNMEWVAYPFSSGSSQPRNWTGVSCIAGRFFTNWAIGPEIRCCHPDRRQAPVRSSTDCLSYRSTALLRFLQIPPAIPPSLASWTSSECPACCVVGPFCSMIPDTIVPYRKSSLKTQGFLFLLHSVYCFLLCTSIIYICIYVCIYSYVYLFW